MVRTFESIFIEILQKYIESEVGMICEFSGNFERSFRHLHEEILKYTQYKSIPELLKEQIQRIADDFYAERLEMYDEENLE